LFEVIELSARSLFLEIVGARCVLIKHVFFIFVFLELILVWSRKLLLKQELSFVCMLIIRVFFILFLMLFQLIN